MSSRRLLGALGLAVGLALAPTLQAQAVDQDPGVKPAPAAPAVQAAPVVDDSDPGGQSEAPTLDPFTGSDQDADARLSIIAPDAPVRAERLDDGRSADARSGAASLTVAVVRTAPLDEGRSADAVAKSSPVAIVAYDGPLDDGRGGVTSDIAAAPRADASTADRPTRAALSTVRPNPAPGRAVLTFRVDVAAPATVVVYDLTGRRVAVAYDAVPAPDVDYRVELDLASVAAGTYVAVLDTGAERLSRTFQVVR